MQSAGGLKVNLCICKVLRHKFNKLKKRPFRHGSYAPSGAESLKADLHGTIFAYDCRMQFLWRALLASWKNLIRFLRYQIACLYDCRRVLKHVSKAHDILCVVHENRKQVVGLIYTKRFMS